MPIWACRRKRFRNCLHPNIFIIQTSSFDREVGRVIGTWSVIGFGQRHKIVARFGKRELVTNAIATSVNGGHFGDALHSVRQSNGHAEWNIVAKDIDGHGLSGIAS